MSIIVRRFLQEKDFSHQQELFHVLDKNCDGKINKLELLDSCIKVFGKKMTADQIDEIFNNVDMDSSGEIDYHEFLLATINESILLTETNLKELFDYLDKVKCNIG